MARPKAIGNCLKSLVEYDKAESSKWKAIFKERAKGRTCGGCAHHGGSYCAFHNGLYGGSIECTSTSIACSDWLEK